MDIRIAIPMNFEVGIGDSFEVVESANVYCERMLNKYIPEGFEGICQYVDFTSDVYDYLDKHGDWQNPIESIVDALLNITCKYIDKTQVAAYFDKNIPSYKASYWMSSFRYNNNKGKYEMDFSIDVEEVKDEQ